MLTRWLVLLLTLVSTAPGARAEMLSDAKQLEQHLCAKDEDEKTEAKAPCVDCLLKAAEEGKLSHVEAPLPAGLRSPKDPKKVQRDLAFFHLLASHGHDFQISPAENSNSVSELESQLASLGETKKDYEKALIERTKKLADLEAQKEAFDHALSGALSDADIQVIHTYVETKTADYQNEIKYYERALAHYTSAAHSSSHVAQEQIRNYKEGLEIFKRKIDEYNPLLDLKSGKSADDKAKARIQTQISAIVHSVEAARYSATEVQDAIKSYENSIQQTRLRIEELKSQDLAVSQDEKDRHELRNLEFSYLQHKLKGLIRQKNFRACGMTPAELMALKLYSMNGYRRLNSALRNAEQASSVKPFAEELNAALKKLAPYKGKVIRTSSLPKAVLDQHQPGNVVTYAAFTSTSLERHSFGTATFVIESHDGHYIAPYSDSEGEHEVLFKAGTRFKVLSRTGSVYSPQIVLEEVEP